jgi:glycine cleavage system H protein
MTIERYTKDHEYIRVDGDVGIVGITNYAQEKLGDVVFVEVPDVGAKVEAGKEAAVVESVKAASDIYAPVSGEVIEANADLSANPALVNEDAQGKAWFFKVRMTDMKQLDGLMDTAAYAAFVKELG